MPSPKTPEAIALWKQRIAQSKLGKKRGPMSEQWKKNWIEGMKKKGMWEKQFFNKISKLGYEARKAKGFLSPEEKKANQRISTRKWTKKNWDKVYAANRRWVAKNLERRREIARESERRRRLLKKQSTQTEVTP
jgi:hypothetical protein